MDDIPRALIPETSAAAAPAARSPGAPKALDERASASLDAMRGIAAIAVVLGHWRGLGLANYSDVAHRSPLLAAFYAACSLGHQAVMIFFVLSGYFVGGSVLRAVATGTWSWRAYAVQRFTRLALVLWPSLVLCAACDFVGMRLFAGSGVYAAAPAYGLILPQPVAALLTVKVALGNALFLQGIATPTFGSNGALWSLSYEFWYYVLFPPLVLAFARARSLAERAAWLVFMALVLAFVGAQLRAYFPIWLLGALVAVVHVPERFAGLARAGVLVLAPAMIAIAMYTQRASIGLAGDTLLGVATALLVACMVASRRPGPPARAFAVIASFTSRTSYSLYLAHLPMLVLLTAATHDGARWQPTLGAILKWSGALVAAYFASLLFYRLTEAHTDRVRRAAMRLARVDRPRPPAVQSVRAG